MLSHYLAFLVIILLLGVSCSPKSQKQSIEEAVVQEPLIEVQSEIELKEEEEEEEYVDELDGMFFTPIGVACREGDIETVKKIVKEKGPDTDAMADEIFVYGPLLTAIQYSRLEIVKYLIEAGANVNRISNEIGWTPLVQACVLTDKRRAYEIAGLLIGAGANVNGAGDLGFDYITYPLFKAIESNNLLLVHLLIESGANITVVNKQAETVFSILQQNNVSEDLKEYIIEQYKIILQREEIE